MSTLLDDVLKAHGGLDRWNKLTTVEADIVTGGAFWAMKGMVQDSTPRRMKVWLHEERASVKPFGDPDWHTEFTHDKVAIIRGDGSVVSERPAPRAAFAGHEKTTPWDPLHRAYFNGTSLWTYLTTPFLLASPQVSVEEISAWEEGDEVWRGLRATFAPHMPVHSQVQDFFFGPDLLLRRFDYDIDVAGGFPAIQMVSDYIEVDGILFPTRRTAYTRAADGKPDPDPLMVSIDISNITYQ